MLNDHMERDISNSNSQVILTVGTMKSVVSWIVKLCSSDMAKHVGGTYCFHIQGQRMSEARRQQGWLADCVLLVSCLAYTSTLKVETVCSSEMSGFFQITWHRNTEDCCNPLTINML
jgi:hypothetical protein